MTSRPDSHGRPGRSGRSAGSAGSGRPGGRPGGSASLPDPSRLLEGRRALVEALSSGAPVTRVHLSPAAARDSSLAVTLDAAREAGATLETADAAFLDACSSHGAHQGVIAEVGEYAYASLADLVRACEGHENALVIACDHITDAGNFGAIVRSAEVVGASGVLIASRRQAQVSAAVYKTSAGAVSHLPVAREANLAASLARLKEEGFWVVGASEHASDVAWDVELSGRVVLVVGAEDRGLARLTRERCDLLVRLPQAGRVGSLNVAQAATALAFEWMRQCREKAAPASAAAPGVALHPPSAPAAPAPAAPPDSPPAPTPAPGAAAAPASAPDFPSASAAPKGPAAAPDSPYVPAPQGGAS